MVAYLITGKLGSGKGLISVAKCYDYLLEGRRVASNVDLFLSGFLSPQSKRTYLRIPDKPTIADLEAIGHGNDVEDYTEDGAPIFDEDRNGLLYLDELGSWMNTRSWQDKSRKELLDYLIHLRKLGWDCLLNVQDIDMLDKQLLGILAEHLVICRRLDRVKVPFFGNAIKAVGGKGKLPKIHRATVHYGESKQDMVVDKWTYMGKRYYRAYNTWQKFTSSYPHGTHSVLSPWHQKGRYMASAVSFRKLLKQRWEAFLNPPRPDMPLKPKHPLVERVMRLPDPVKRLEFLRRFQECGALDTPLEQLSRLCRRELEGLV